MKRGKTPSRLRGLIQGKLFNSSLEGNMRLAVNLAAAEGLRDDRRALPLSCPPHFHQEGNPWPAFRKQT